MIVTVRRLFFVLLFGAMAAFALSEYRFKGNTLMGLYLALGIMIPIRLGTVAILQMMVASGAGQHADGADPGLHRAGPAAGGLHPVGVHARFRMT
jgi:ABC-type glycerol-3-phosphate transport system permease component